ncbi:hypothetical protein [Flavobacterium caseinilyticum]|uniref:Uncharacterized protein n=1 Tax=Flavobacterium caseinilyticum TaxID=2541732 RepID=A0A4R5AYA7_9FLAO|nr:hypothetical protein [Flavobacterium caseinilyticum]TDD77109.1 hypothetical protein E0F89_05790 [Flavobacterium caseinilyticum]
MANSGTYTAYRQLKPLEGSIADDMQQQQDNSFKRQHLKSQEEKTKQDRIDKAEKEKRELWEKHVKPLSNYDTGSKSLNEAQGRLILEAQKEYVPLMAVVNNPNASDDERLKATIKLQNINNLPENLSSMTKTLTERDLAIKKGIAAGTMFADPVYDKNYQEGFQNKLLALDDNGMPMVAFKDLDGDGKDDLETYDQIQNVVPKYEIQQRFDRNADLIATSKNLQPNANDKDLLTAYTNSQLYELDGVTPTARLKSYARDAGITDYTNTAALKVIATNYTNDVLLRVKPDTAQQALEQKILNDAENNRIARERLRITESEGAKNRKSAAEARTERLEQEAAGKTTVATATMDNEGNTVTTTKSQGNGKTKSNTNTTTKKKVYAGIDPKTGKAIYK